MTSGGRSCFVGSWGTAASSRFRRDNSSSRMIGPWNLLTTPSNGLAPYTWNVLELGGFPGDVARTTTCCPTRAWSSSRMSLIFLINRVWCRFRINGFVSKVHFDRPRFFTVAIAAAAATPTVPAAAKCCVSSSWSERSSSSSRLNNPESGFLSGSATSIWSSLDTCVDRDLSLSKSSGLVSMSSRRQLVVFGSRLGRSIRGSVQKATLLWAEEDMRCLRG